METQSKLNEKINLAAQVDFDAEKPAFNILMKTTNGAVALIALKEGQKLDRHLAPADVVITVLEGNAVFTLDDSTANLAKGDAILMNAGTPHEVNALADTKIMLVKIDA